jgi:hypothetical protein
MSRPGPLVEGFAERPQPGKAAPFFDNGQKRRLDAGEIHVGEDNNAPISPALSQSRTTHMQLRSKESQSYKNVSPM